MHCNPLIVLKLLLASLCFGIMSYFIITCLRTYFNYPTQTRVNILLNRSQIFPAVTICSGNPLRYDKFLLPVIKYIRTHNLLQNPPNLTESDVYYGTFNFMIDLLNQNKTDQMMFYGFQLEDILLDCSFNGYDCRGMWAKSLSPVLGNCYTFNHQTVDKKSPVFQINDVNGENLAYHSGLAMTFYLNIELYFPTVEYGLGLTGLLHHPDEQPLIRYSGKRFSPGFEHSLVYENSLSTYLGSPYTPCTHQMTDDMKSLYTFFDNNTDYAYSETVCVEICFQRYIYEKCRCIFPNFFYLNQLVINNRLQWVRTCTPWTSEYKCTIQARQNISDDENKQKNYCSYCQSQCIIHKYSADLSLLKGPSNAQKSHYAPILLSNSTIPIKSDFRNNSNKYLENNYLKLTINPLNAYVTTYQEKATYNWSALISDLGGQVGLWLGVSCLSLFDFFAYLHKKSQVIRVKRTTEIQAFESNAKSSPPT